MFLIPRLACSRNCRAAVKALLIFKSFELLSKTIGSAQTGQVTEKTLRILDWCSLKIPVHFPQTILIFDISAPLSGQHPFIVHAAQFLKSFKKKIEKKNRKRAKNLATLPEQTARLTKVMPA